MTKRDEEDLGLALVSGGFGALLGYGKSQSTIQNLQAQIRAKDQQINNLEAIISTKNFIITQKDRSIAQRDEEIRKLKEGKKSNTSVKDLAKSLFDKI